MFLWLILMGDDHGHVVAECHHFEGLVSGRAWGCNGGGYHPLAETVFVYINASRYPLIREAFHFVHSTRMRFTNGQRSSSLRGVPCVKRNKEHKNDRRKK